MKTEYEKASKYLPEELLNNTYNDQAENMSDKDQVIS